MRLAFVVLCWGFAPCVMRWCAAPVGPGAFTCLRYAASAAVLAAAFRRCVAVDARSAGKLVLLGAATLFPFSYFFLRGLTLAGVAISSLVQGTIPAVTAALSFALFGVRVRWTTGVGIVLAYAGVAILVEVTAPGRGGVNLPPGIAFLMIDVACFGVFTVLAARAGRTISASTIAFFTSVGAAAAAIPFAWSEGAGLAAGSGRVLLGALYMALLATMASQALYVSAARDLGAVRASLVTNLVPLVGLTGGAVFFGDRLPAAAVWAAALVLGGSALGSTPPRVAATAGQGARVAPSTGQTSPP
jgi:O-acetylserine/cysteine efflux transporter